MTKGEEIEEDLEESGGTGGGGGGETDRGRLYAPCPVVAYRLLSVSLRQQQQQQQQQHEPRQTVPGDGHAVAGLSPLDMASLR